MPICPGLFCANIQSGSPLGWIPVIPSYAASGWRRSLKKGAGGTPYALGGMPVASGPPATGAANRDLGLPIDTLTI